MAADITNHDHFSFTEVPVTTACSSCSIVSTIPVKLTFKLCNNNPHAYINVRNNAIRVSQYLAYVRVQLQDFLIYEYNAAWILLVQPCIAE
jgi:hypothetical protein